MMLLTCLLVVVLFLTCKKDDNGPVSATPPPSSGTPEPTPIGTPVGTATTARIGPSGGSVQSSDGKLSVNIPAGILNTDTTISVQPITNNAPNGLGTAYRLGPSGMHFSSPITLRFSYASDTIQVPELTGVAYQDTDGIWYEPPDYSVDSLTQTVSAAVNHFSDWTDFEEVNIYPVRATLWPNQTLALELRESIVAEMDTQPRPIYRVTNDQVTWSASAGSISGGSAIPGCNCAPATYRAPGAPPAMNPVRISATVNRRFTYHGSIVPTNRTIFFSYVTITDSSSTYHIDLYFRNPNYTVSYQQFTLSDTAGMDVTIRRRTVSVSNITNTPPGVTPPEVSGGDCTLTWLPGDPGPMNLRSAVGSIDSSGNVVLSIYQTAFEEQFRLACTGQQPVTFGGNPIPGVPDGLVFPANINIAAWVHPADHVDAHITRQ